MVASNTIGEVDVRVSWVREDDDADIVCGKKNSWERRMGRKTDVERAVPIMLISSVFGCLACLLFSYYP